MARQKNPLLSTEKYKQYRQLAKRADQQMVRLEKLSQKEGYENVLKYAYKRASSDIKAWGITKAGKQFRFNVRPTSEKQLDKMIKDVERFLESKTNTKGKIDALYNSRRETIKERYGVDMTWEQIANYFESGIAKKFDMKYGSKTALKSLGIIQKRAAETYKELKDSMQSVQVMQDAQAEGLALKMMRYYKNDLKKVVL